MGHADDMDGVFVVHLVLVTVEFAHDGFRRLLELISAIGEHKPLGGPQKEFCVQIFFHPGDCYIEPLGSYIKLLSGLGEIQVPAYAQKVLQFGYIQSTEPLFVTRLGQARAKLSFFQE
jgi:hypothetical protein